MKNKIIYVVSTLARCGPTNQLYGIISNLDTDRFDPMIITLSPEGSDSDRQKFLDADIAITSLGLSKQKGLFLSKSKLSKLIDSHKPSIIHTSGLRADSLVSSIDHNSNHFSTIRCYPYEEYIGLYGKLMGSIIASKHMNVIKRTQKPIACSKSISHILQEKHGIDVEYVQNGIDDKRFKKTDDAQKIALKKSLKLDAGKKIFIMSGSLIHRKNPMYAIEAFCKANLQNSLFVIIGDGDLMQKCKSIANNNVLFFGKINNTQDYLNASDIIVSSSYSEGLPNSILEAMGCGNCLLLSDIPQHMEILDACDDAGDSFSLDDIENLVDLFKSYEKDNIDSKKKSSYESFKAHFTALITSKNYQIKYENTIVNKNEMYI